MHLAWPSPYYPKYSQVHKNLGTPRSPPGNRPVPWTLPLELPGVLWLFGQMDRCPALFAGDDRHTRVYGAQRRRFQCSLCAGKSGQFAQLVERRKRDRETSPLEALQSVGGPNPDARAGLQTVIDGFLFGGSAGQEEMRVEALRRRLRRNPVCEIDEEIGCQHELFGARYLQQRDALLIQRLAVASKARRTAPVKREHAVIAVGKQYIRLLKKLTNGRGPDAVAEGGLPLYIRRRWRNGTAYPGGLLGQAISRRDGAAGEDKNIRHKLALGDAPDHKYLYSFALWLYVAQQHNTGRQTRLNRHAILSILLLAPAALTSCY